jgi:hypothetical protein
MHTHPPTHTLTSRFDITLESNSSILLLFSTQIYVRRRKPFEQRILRNYYHVVPLEETEKDAWREYLVDMESRVSSLTAIPTIIDVRCTLM